MTLHSICTLSACGTSDSARGFLYQQLGSREPLKHIYNTVLIVDVNNVTVRKIMIWPLLLVLSFLASSILGECPFSNPVKLTRDKFTVSVRYKSTNTTLTVELTALREGYLGFGLSPDGLMRDRTCVMGGGDNFEVAKYSLFNRGAGKLPSSRQTLVDERFRQSEGTSILTFTKLLADGDHDEIDPFGENLFIWALGQNNDVSGNHFRHGAVKITLSPFPLCKYEEESPEKIPFKGHFKTHGILAAVGWGILSPIAIAASAFRQSLNFNLQKTKAWMVIHNWFNAITSLLTLGLVSVAIDAYQKKGKAHFQETHDVIGFIIMLIVLIQVMSGLFRPPLPPPPESIEENGFESDPSSPFKKSIARKYWEVFHIVAGVCLMLLSIHQMYSGEYIYRVRYRGSDLRIVLWVWLGIIAILLIYVAYNRGRMAMQIK